MPFILLVCLSFAVLLLLLLLLLQLLAGANINELTLERQSSLHLAAVYNQPAIASILIENGIDFSLLDQQRYNGMMIAHSVTLTAPSDISL